MDESLPVLDIKPIKTWSLKPRDFSRQGFQIVDLARHCNWRPSLDWDRNDSYAPCTFGERYAFGVPFFLVPAYLNQDRAALRDGHVSVGLKTKAASFFVSEINDGTEIEVRYEDGARERVLLDNITTAWKAWPRWFPAEIALAPHPCRDAAIESVNVRGGVLWAITVASSDAGVAKILGLAAKPKKYR